MTLTEMLQVNLKNLPVPLSDEGLPLEPARLLHIPGDMNIDVYPPLVFLALYRPCQQKEAEEIAEQVESVLPGSPLLIQDRSERPFRVLLEKGDIPHEMIVTEGQLEFCLNPKRGQNPGFFIDMRDGRRLIGDMVGELKTRGEVKVLNLFAYTCSLSVAALAAGAARVVNIDMNQKSLNVGKKNHRMNHSRIPGGYNGQALFLSHDIFKSFGKLRREGPYDLIIADPPPSQRGSFDLWKDYPRLISRLPDMLCSEGVLLLTLNSPEADWADFEKMVIEALPEDFSFKPIAPPLDFRPREEGRGLKLLLARKDK
ncbi:MAG: class I SAM-dependent methyltransferase [Spirochaetales bacterium]|nr:class I SAM-dependent methyltransferase [Spirochaetales bacterium]